MTQKQKDNGCLTLFFSADASGCGFLRTMWPNEYLNAMFQNCKKYEGIVLSRFAIKPELFRIVKNIRFQRQITNDQVDFIEFVRNYRDKTPEANYQIIYDVDDLYTAPPTYNSAVNFYGNPNLGSKQTIQNVLRIVNLVDIFTVSSYDLKKEIEKFGGTCKVKVISTYVPKSIYKPYTYAKETPSKTGKPKIVWAGSTSHFNNVDMGDFALIFDLIHNTHNEFDWNIMGMNTSNSIPDWFKPLQDKVTFTPWTRSIHSFPTQLKELNADFGIAPLLNNDYNRCKSNIKLLDYASSDMVAITSKLAPYKESSVFLENNWRVDREQIIDIYQNKTKKEEIINSQNKVLDKYWLETKGLAEYRKLFKF